MRRTGGAGETMSLVLMLVTAAALGRALGRLFPLGQDLEGWLFRGALGLGGVAVAALFAGAVRCSSRRPCWSC